MTDKKLKLTKANEVFINEYLTCFNGTEAYSRAYPKANRNSARANASNLLANPNIKSEIERRLAEVHMSADEALKLLSDIARGDIGDFINNFGGVDLVKAREAGKTRLIKKVKTRTITSEKEEKEIVEEEIELYPADAALRDVLKIHGKFKENLNVNLPGGLVINVVKASESKDND